MAILRRMQKTIPKFRVAFKNKILGEVGSIDFVDENFQLLEKRDNTGNHTSMEDQMSPNFSGPTMDIDDDGLPF